MPATPQQQAVLNKIGRQGWDVVSTTLATELEPGEVGAVRRPKYPEGSETWVITDGKGHNQTMVVKPAAAPNVPYENPNDPGATEWMPTVIDPPKDLPAAAAGSRAPTPASGLEIIKDPNTGKPIKLRDPATGTVIDLPDAPAGGKPQIVQGPKGSIYAWDGTSLTPLLAGTPDAPVKPQIIQGERGALYSWDGSSLREVKPAEAKGRDVAVVNDQLVDRNTGEVIYTAPAGVKFQTAQDGTVLAVDPANPSNVQVVWKPEKTPTIMPGQKPDQPNFIQQNPDGSLTSTPNPIYSPVAIQRFQELHDGISHIEGMLTRGEIDFTTANKYKDALQKNFDASLRGTTPYQEWQDQQARAQARMQSGQSLLNQRVASGSGLAQSLLNSAVSIVGNKNFMDPSAVMGFSPFAGARDYVTELGGGQGVYDAAAGAVKTGLGGGQAPMSDPAMALLQAAINKPASNYNPNDIQWKGADTGQGFQDQSVVNPQTAPPQQEIQPFAQSDIHEGSGRGMSGNQQPQDENDPALALMRAAGLM